MKKNIFLRGLNLAFINIFFLLTSCSSAKKHLTDIQPAILTDSIQIMATSITRDLSKEGPAAWLHYFADTPGFFMVSGGKLVFPDFKHAAVFINDTLVKQISKIELHWRGMRIDSLTPGIAMMGASFNEMLTDVKGAQIRVNGYFTGLVQHTRQGWKFANANWSIAEK